MFTFCWYCEIERVTFKEGVSTFCKAETEIGMVGEGTSVYTAAARMQAITGTNWS